VSWYWHNKQLDRIEDKLDQLLKGQVKEMAAIDDLMTAIVSLTTAITAETADIDAALALIVTPGATPAQIKEATDAISAATANIAAETAKIKLAVPGAP